MPIYVWALNVVTNGSVSRQPGYLPYWKMDAENMSNEDRKDYYKAERRRLAAAGLCQNCAKNPVNGTTLCDDCRRIHNERQNVRYQKRKQRIVDYMGGVCEGCGQSYPLCVYDLHHIERGVKDYSFGGNAIKRPLEELKPELDKCALLCSNCHRILHSQDGGPMQWKRKSKHD
jgi:hypothetical protein